jgi:hypothetical protein
MDIETETLDELYCSSNPAYEVDGWRHIARGLTERQENYNEDKLTKLHQVWPHTVTTVEYKTTP